MSLRQLRTLIAVADTRTFAEAAARVHLTHAAVSQHMLALEADLGVTLFDRSRRSPELTPMGHRIVTKARALLADYDALVPRDMDGLNGTLRLGAIGTTLTGLTPQAMAALKASHAGLGLHIRPGLTHSLAADIARGTLDAALVTAPDPLPVGLAFRPLATEVMDLITAPEEPDEDPPRLLATRPYIRFNRAAVVGGLIERWIVSKRLRVHETMELDSVEAIASMVHANLGVSIVPRPVVPAMHGPPVKSLPLGDNAPRRVIGLLTPSEPSNPAAINALWDALKSVTA